MDFYFNLLEQKENNKLVILDYEYILVCSILDELIAVDISHIPIILAQYLDKFWNLSEKETKMKDDEIKLKKALEDKNNELINNLKNDVKNNFNKLHDYQEEIKALKEKIKSNKEKYKNDIEQRKKDYENKYIEIKKGFDDKIISLLEDQKKLKEK